MTLEERVTLLETLLINMHRNPPNSGLGIETTFNHPAAVSIGTMQPIGLRAEACDGGTVNDSISQVAIFGTVETPSNAPEHVGVLGQAINGKHNYGIRGLYQQVSPQSCSFLAQEINNAGTALTSLRISPYGVIARGEAQEIYSFNIDVGGYALLWDNGHIYWKRPDNSRTLLA